MLCRLILPAGQGRDIDGGWATAGYRDGYGVGRESELKVN
jgi:hypothetical protein